jgi:hypothetical protein
MSVHLGDCIEDSVLSFCWESIATGGTLKIYKDDNTTESTAGVTDTRDFDGIIGIHNCKIDLSSDAFYAMGHDYSIVLVGAVIDGETVNAALATFSIQNRYMRGTDIAALASVCTETRLSKLDAAISSRASASDYTSARAGKLDNLDATVSSRASGNICTEARLAKLDAENLPKAAKVLTNKAVQDKSTGAIQYYDDDGQTIILTHTPTDGESTIIRTPS